MSDSDDSFDTPVGSTGSIASKASDADETLVNNTIVDNRIEVARLSMVQPTPEVLARIKRPVFTPDDPEVWFQQVEWHLADAGVTNSTLKFRQVAKSLDGKYSKEVRDLIMHPSDEKLKEDLLRRLGKSQAHKTRQLLEREDIGDRKPLQFLPPRLPSLKPPWTTWPKPPTM